jgi:hypothetical protein
MEKMLQAQDDLTPMTDIGGGMDVHGIHREPAFRSGGTAAKKPPAVVAKAVVSPQNGNVEPIVTMIGILKSQELDILRLLQIFLRVGTASFACPVEIEFAVQLSENEKDLHTFSLLQIRPMTILSAEFSDFSLKTLPGPEHAVVASRRVLGLGKFSSNDIVYVRDATFNVSVTDKIAKEIAALNATLSKQGRSYILITKGRLGANNKNLGVPVSWDDISKVSCIVETSLSKTETTAPPSEGSHFFHNLTSLGIGFLTVYSPDDGHVDFDWLEKQPAEFEGYPYPHPHHTLSLGLGLILTLSLSLSLPLTLTLTLTPTLPVSHSHPNPHQVLSFGTSNSKPLWSP